MNIERVIEPVGECENKLTILNVCVEFDGLTAVEIVNGAMLGLAEHISNCDTEVER